MQFVHAFDAIFELATVLRELLGYFVDAAWIAPRGERRIPSQSKYRTAMPRGAVQANASTRMLPYEGLGTPAAAPRSTKAAMSVLAEPSQESHR
jgi:hypothetical protein